MKKSDLKVGYVVKFRNNEIGIIMQTNQGSIIIQKDETYNKFNFFSEDLTNINGDYDIMEVYGFTNKYYTALRISKEDRKLLWKRKDKKEMTISEIEKELGYPIKVVKEREDN